MLRERLLAERTDAGHWVGELSSSALSTATAVCALKIVGGHEELVARGLEWLEKDQNTDGGFGDAHGCPSNISTTTLAWATLSMLGSSAAGQAESWLKNEVGELTADRLADAICRVYGADRTFSVPILTMCAIAGRLDWDQVPTLPFELAALPRSLFSMVGLPVVSYALPALIAIGQVKHHRQPTRNPVTRLARELTRNKTLRLLESIQPESGGFLEAAPLTSFVTMSLAECGLKQHPVAMRGLKFLKETVREDGSWPIDTNLATWLTTNAIKALGGESFSPEEKQTLRKWLLDQQGKEAHPYTQAAPGGWAWTDLSGGVPDADDTAGALLAIAELGDDDEIRKAALAGVGWLIDLQNRDGGIPTFCRGWGRFPFDQSCSDVTAHTLMAWERWSELDGRIEPAMARAVEYLVHAQRTDGSWLPLWFGNPWAADRTNPVFGTARVLQCGHLLPEETRRRGREYLLSVQKEDGGFGGIEETAMAVLALKDERGARWLSAIEEMTPSPIGLYFASLWYYEKLYPLIFTTAALNA